MRQLLTGVALIAFGALEGYAFFRCGMCSPQALLQQMGFQSMIVMKLFMSAVGTSMMAQSVMDYLSPAKFATSRQMSKTTVGYARAIGGCFVLGIGMGLSGAGPTIVPAQLFGGASNALYVTAGALAGGSLYAVVGDKLFSKDVTAKPGEKTTVDMRMGRRYFSLAAPIGAAMVAAMVLLDRAWPNAVDQQRLGFDPQSAWNPILAGAVIGLNQLPLRYLANKGQGGSTSIMNIIATATGGIVANEYVLKSVVGAAQLLYVWGGTSVGAYAARVEAGSAFQPPEGASVTNSFLGGVLMLLGARTAMGCTCGHGISGFSELSLQSIPAAMAIFAGGIATHVVRHGGF